MKEQATPVPLNTNETSARIVNDKYYSIFNSIDEGFCIYELIHDNNDQIIDLRWVEVNPAYEKQTGLKNVVGKLHSDLSPGTEKNWFRIYDEVLKTGKPVSFEEWHEPTGRWYKTFSSRIGDIENKQVAVLFSDITERKQRESRLAFLAEIGDDFSRLSGAEEIMQTVGAKLGAYLKITTCNFTDVDEANDRVIVHNGWSDPSVPSTVGTFRMSQYLNEDFQKTSRAGETVIICDTQTDSRTDAAGYAALDMYSFVTVPFHHQGKWTHYIAICHSKPRNWNDDDVKLIEEVCNRIFPRLEKARAEEALRLSEEKFRDLFNSMDEGYCIIQMLYDENDKPYDWLYIELNPAFEKHNGLKNAVGRTILELVPDIEYKWMELYSGVAKTGKSVRTTEDSQPFERVFDLYIFRVGRPEEHKVAVLFTDITDRRKVEKASKEFNHKLEKQVEERTTQLKQTISQLEAFNYVASHDLQEPLRKIRTYVELLKELRPDHKEMNAYISSIADSSSRMSQLIDSLLSYSRNTRVTETFRPVDLNKILNAVKGDYEIVINEKNAVIRSDELPVIKAIPFQMTQLFSNLIGNALKFSDKKPLITIKARTVKGNEISFEAPEDIKEKWFTEITISDNGIGFDNRYREKIFQLFQRLNTHSDYSGTGIGLSIVSKIVQQHNGYIKAKGKLNEGAVFTVYLPL